MRYQAVIFDLFGTLVDYLLPGEYAYTREEIADILAVPEDVLHRVWAETMPARDEGRFGGIEDDIRQICRLLGREPNTEQLQTIITLRLALYRRNLLPREDARHVLNILQQEGYRVGLVSNCGNEIPLLWPESSFATLIEAPVFSVEMGMRKPDPRIYQAACERLGVMPEQCLYVGDGSDGELAGAQRLGMDAVLICVSHEREMVMQREDACSWQGPVIEQLTGVLDYLAMADAVAGKV